MALDTILPSFYNLNESEVINNSDIPAGAVIFCKDSTNIYMTPVTGGVPQKMSEVIISLTEEARQDILAPVNGKYYFCYDSGKLWTYYNAWFCLNAAAFVIDEVVLDTQNGGKLRAVVNDVKIRAGAVGTFVPDPSVRDLISNITVTCTNGTATIAATGSYPIFGKLKIG